MRASRRRLAVIGAAAAVPSALMAVPAASAATTSPAATAAPPPPDRASPTFCSTGALTPQQLDAGVLSTVRCYGTYEDSLRAIGVNPSAELQTTSADRATSADVVANADGIIAVHSDDISGRGYQLVIGGTDCNGGGVSFPAGDPWNDRIRYTAPRGCSTVKHWTEPDYTGQLDTVTGTSRALSPALSGRVSSIRYFS